MLATSKIQWSPALTVCKGVASTTHVDECVSWFWCRHDLQHLSGQSWRKQTFCICSQIPIKFGPSMNPCHQTNVSSCEIMRIAFARHMIPIKCHDLVLITTCWLSYHFCTFLQWFEIKKSMFPSGDAKQNLQHACTNFTWLWWWSCFYDLFWSAVFIANRLGKKNARKARGFAIPFWLMFFHVFQHQCSTCW